MDQERDSAQKTERAWSEAIARVWLGDEAFRTELLANPRSVLETLGADLPLAVSVSVVENSPAQMTFVLPLRPRALGQLQAADVLEMYGTCPCTVCSTGRTPTA